MPNVALFVVGLVAGIGVMMLVLAIRSAPRGNLRPEARRGDPSPEPTGCGLRCSLCGIDWPANAGDYGRCPVCLEPTDLIGGDGVHPLDCIQARSIKLHHEFERFYAAWNRNDAG